MKHRIKETLHREGYSIFKVQYRVLWSWEDVRGGTHDSLEKAEKHIKDIKKKEVVGTIIHKYY